MESTILSKEEIRSELFANLFVDLPTDRQIEWQTEGRMVISYLIFSFFNDSRLLAPKYSEYFTLSAPPTLYSLSDSQIGCSDPSIFLIQFSDQISLLFSVHKLLFWI